MGLQVARADAEDEPSGSSPAPLAEDLPEAETATDEFVRMTALDPERHRQRRAANRGTGGRAREEDRARRPPRQTGDGGGEPALGCLDREAVPQPGPTVPRLDPRGHDWAAPCRREVRLPQGLQVLHVRDVVDPTGRTPRLADMSRTIRMPVHIVERLGKMRRAERTLWVRLGRSRRSPRSPRSPASHSSMPGRCARRRRLR